MHGYWDDPERTREVDRRGGWMHSGDLATLDAAGYCNIVGRLKDMLIRGGENVYPREIEEFLLGHPKIQAAQVFGVPDPRLGEEVCAWIVLKPGAAITRGGDSRALPGTHRALQGASPRSPRAGLSRSPRRASRRSSPCAKR